MNQLNTDSTVRHGQLKGGQLSQLQAATGTRVGCKALKSWCHIKRMFRYRCGVVGGMLSSLAGTLRVTVGPSQLQQRLQC
jgi:hypothetical protein